MGALAAQRGVGLRMIADAVSGLDPLVGIGELVVWHEDDPAAYEDLAARAEAGTLVVPWSIPFPLLGEDFHFALNLEVSGEVMLEPDEPSADQPEGRKAVRVIPTESTRGRLRWDPDQAAAPMPSDDNSTGFVENPRAATAWNPSPRCQALRSLARQTAQEIRNS